MNENVATTVQDHYYDGDVPIVEEIKQASVQLLKRFFLFYVRWCLLVMLVGLFYTFVAILHKSDTLEKQKITIQNDQVTTFQYVAEGKVE